MAALNLTRGNDEGGSRPAARTASSRVTQLLRAWGHGDRRAFAEVFPMVVAELRRIARRQLADERDGHTLQPTALINEVYLRWAGQRGFGWRSRAQFFKIAAAQMRHILVEHARRKNALKRGGRGTVPVSLADADEPGGDPTAHCVDLVDLDRALTRLEEMDPELSRIVELRYFAGLSARNAAEVMGLSERTVLRHWRWIKAWLLRQLTTGGKTR